MSLENLRLGQLSQLADNANASCSEAQHNAEVFARLAKKKDKSAKTRADAAGLVDYWNSVAKTACNPTPALPVPGTVAPTPTPATPVPTAPLTVTPGQTGGPYPAYAVAPQVYDSSNIQASPYISPSISADIVAALTAANPIPAGSGVSVPSVNVGSGAALVECSSEYAAALPLEYDDSFGPMKVVQVRCV